MRKTISAAVSLPSPCAASSLFIEPRCAGHVAFVSEINAQAPEQERVDVGQIDRLQCVANGFGIALQSHGQREDRLDNRTRLRIAAPGPLVVPQGLGKFLALLVHPAGREEHQGLHVIALRLRLRDARGRRGPADHRPRLAERIAVRRGAARGGWLAWANRGPTASTAAAAVKTAHKTCGAPSGKRFADPTRFISSLPVTSVLRFERPSDGDFLCGDSAWRAWSVFTSVRRGMGGLLLRPIGRRSRPRFVTGGTFFLSGFLFGRQPWPPVRRRGSRHGPQACPISPAAPRAGRGRLLHRRTFQATFRQPAAHVGVDLQENRSRTATAYGLAE